MALNGCVCALIPHSPFFCHCHCQRTNQIKSYETNQPQSHSLQVDEDFPDPPPYGQASTTTGGSSSSEPGKAAAAASGGGGAGGDAASAAAAAAGCGGAVDDVNPRVFALFKQVIQEFGYLRSCPIPSRSSTPSLLINNTHPQPPSPQQNTHTHIYTSQVKGLVLTLIEDLTVLKLYIRLASPAIVDGSFNSAVQVCISFMFVLFQRVDGRARCYRWTMIGSVPSIQHSTTHLNKQTNKQKHKTKNQEEILDVISTSRHAGLTVIQVISKYFVERAHYVVKVRTKIGKGGGGGCVFGGEWGVREDGCG